MASHLKTGQLGETEGVFYLRGLGYRILETNYKTLIGEVDCIAKDKKTIVFIEVKTRKGAGYGLPEEAVGRQKQRKVAQVAQYYLKTKGWLDKVQVRFDVLAILVSEIDQISLNHIQNAFEIESKENT